MLCLTMTAGAKGVKAPIKREKSDAPIRSAMPIGPSKNFSEREVSRPKAKVKATKEHRELIKQHIYGDYKKMLKKPTGIALKYPYLTPGSQQYARVLWDWDSWLSDVALRQTLNDVPRHGQAHHEPRLPKLELFGAKHGSVDGR